MTEPTLEDWARISPTLRRTGAALVGLADLAVGHLDLRWEVEPGARLDQAVLERPGDREGLEGGAGLVAGADRAVLARVGGRAPDVVGVDAGPVGHGQQLAAARVHHQCRGGPGPERAAHLAHHGLHPLLQRSVDRERQVLACLGAVGVDDAHRLPGGVLDQPTAAVLAVQLLLVLLLDPRQPHVVGAHGAEELARERALRVGPARLGDRVDALDAELGDLLAEVGVQLAPQVDEAAALRQQLEQVLLGAADQRREPGRGVRTRS